MKNTVQILELIIKNIKDMHQIEDYKSLNENIILYQETLNTYCEYIELNHYTYLKSLSYKLSDYNLVNSITFGESKSSRLILNSINILNSIIKKYKDKTSINEFYNSKDVKITKLLTSDKAKKMLEYSIENNILVVTFNDTNRRIGKTTELIKKANEIGCTLIVSSHTSKEYCKQLFDVLKVECQIIIGNDKDLIGGVYCKNKLFLVDEFVSKSIIDILIRNGNKLIGGFVNYNKF